jgi:hypothetical protein
MTKRPVDYYLLWGLVILSLAVNAGLVYALVGARAKAAEGAQMAAEAVKSLRGASFDYTAYIEETLPVSLTLPFNTSIAVPISVTLPINTEFSFTIHTFFGDFPVNIPVNANVPVNVQPVVPVRVNVPVSTTVPVVFDVPVHIDLEKTDVGKSLAPTQAYLERLAADLKKNPFLAIVPR